MFCPNCGKAVEDTAGRCASCGTRVAAGAAGAAALQDVAQVVKATSRDAWSAFKTFAVNPVGGLAPVFQAFGPSRAMGVGIAFGVVFALSLTISFNRLAGRLASMVPFGAQQLSGDLGSNIKLMVIGLAPFLSIAVACALARVVFRGVGTFAGDLFVAGTCLLPTALLLLISGFLGVGNIEVIVILYIFALCYTILILYSGCTTVSQIPGSLATLAVPCVLIFGSWITKVIIASLF